MSKKISKYFKVTPKGLKSNKNSLNRFECDFDGKIFEAKHKLNEHMKMHLSLIECKICHKMLTFNGIKVHLRNLHGNDEKFQCKICSKTSKYKDLLNRHEKIHNKKFECEICKKMFISNGRLNRHIKLYHDYENSFECENCGKKFKQKHHLKDHQKTHDKNRPKPYKCQRCDYSTDHKRSYNDHQKVHEYQDKKIAAMKNPKKCEKCPAFFKDEPALRRHMVYVHPKILFQCDLCAKFIKTKSNLTKHIELHIKKLTK